MATFDIKTLACDFTETLEEHGIVEEIDYPHYDEVGIIRLWSTEDEKDTWVEVLVTEEGLKGILVEGFGEYRTPAEWTETADLILQIQKLWEQFLK